MNYISNLDYIEANVLNIPRVANPSVGLPWKNSSFEGGLCFSGVFKTDSTFTEINPDLASGYTVSDDGLTYVVTLKDKLKWSDGTDLTINDFKWSIETFLLLTSTNSTVANALSYIEGVADWREGKTDSLTGLSISGNDLTIKLTAPYSSFALVLTQFVLLPEHSLKDEDHETFFESTFFTNPERTVTSGMYKADSINEDGDLVLVHNPHYYAEHSDIETVIMRGDYQNMHTDFHSTSSVTEMVTYRSIPGYEEFNVDVYFYRYFVTNRMAEYQLPEMISQVGDDGNTVYIESTEPIEYDNENRPTNDVMDDVRIRQAIAHAIDADSIHKDAYLSQGQIAYAGAINQSERVYDYNLDKAKELFVEAGYDFERPFTIGFYHSDANSTALLAKVKNALEEIGLTVRLVKASGAVALYEQREYDMFLKALSAFNTEDWYGEYLSTNPTINKVLGTDEFDDLIDQLYTTTDINSYENVLAQLVELEQELMYKIPIIASNDSVYINGNRVSVPDDMVFGNNRYRCDLRLDEWYIKKA